LGVAVEIEMVTALEALVVMLDCVAEFVPVDDAVA